MILSHTHTIIHQIFFVPQRPYCAPGRLADQITYPLPANLNNAEQMQRSHTSTLTSAHVLTMCVGSSSSLHLSRSRTSLSGRAVGQPKTSGKTYVLLICLSNE